MWDVNLYGFGKSQKFFAGGFKWVESMSQLNKDFIENYSVDRVEGCFVEVDVQYLEKLHDLHIDLPFLPGRMKIEKLIANLHDKKNVLYTWKN